MNEEYEEKAGIQRKREPYQNNEETKKERNRKRRISRMTYKAINEGHEENEKLTVGVKEEITRRKEEKLDGVTMRKKKDDRKGKQLNDRKPIAEKGNIKLTHEFENRSYNQCKINGMKTNPPVH